MCVGKQVSRAEESKLCKDGPDERHVGTSVAITIRGLKLWKLFSGWERKKALPNNLDSAGQIRLREDV